MKYPEQELFSGQHAWANRNTTGTVYETRDERLRRFGWELTDRPAKGPAWWRKGQLRATEARAHELCDRLRGGLEAG